MVEFRKSKSQISKFFDIIKAQDLLLWFLKLLSYHLWDSLHQMLVWRVI